MLVIWPAEPGLLALRPLLAAAVVSCWVTVWVMVGEAATTTLLVAAE
jgi:hypothetical protein